MDLQPSDSYLKWMSDSEEESATVSYMVHPNWRKEIKKYLHLKFLCRKNELISGSLTLCVLWLMYLFVSLLSNL